MFIIIPSTHRSSSIDTRMFRNEKNKIKPSKRVRRHLHQVNHGASSHLNRVLQISRRIPRTGTISLRLIIQMESKGSKINGGRRIDAFADRSIIFSPSHLSYSWPRGTRNDPETRRGRRFLFGASLRPRTTLISPDLSRFADYSSYSSGLSPWNPSTSASRFGAHNRRLHSNKRSREIGRNQGPGDARRPRILRGRGKYYSSFGFNVLSRKVLWTILPRRNFCSVALVYTGSGESMNE